MSYTKKACSLELFFVDDATSDEHASLIIERIHNEKAIPKLIAKKPKAKRRAA